MIKLRPQYHLRRTSVGIDAFDVRRLIELAKGLPVRMIDPRQLVELDEDHWYSHTNNRPTPRSIIEHLRLVRRCDTRYPIILDQDGRVMDGMHRVCKAIMEEEARIPAVQFAEDPAPDFVNCDPSMLPYESS
jgi:hypothetical protein